MSERALRIGITIGLFAEDESLWTNGIKQNALFLAKLFMTSPLGHHVVLLNTTLVRITPALPWSLEDFPTEPLGDGDLDFDIVFELGGQLSADQTEALKRRGARLVSYGCASEYVQNIEAMIFRRPMWDSIFVNRRFDALWMIPQAAETSLWFLQTLRRRPARVVPFVWDPMALEAAAGGLPNGGEYRPHGGAKRLSVIEPNIDVLKFCLYPLFIAERAYRETPQAISFLHVTNADALVRDDREFAGVARQLDIVRDGKASFVGRFGTPRFLAEHTDVVISHQWGSPLNYLYFEVCWQGYPFVHNAHLCPELGYYYRENDIDEAGRVLVEVLARHDQTWETYRERQRRLLRRFMASNPQLAATYDEMMFALLAQPPAP